MSSTWISYVLGFVPFTGKGSDTFKEPQPTPKPGNPFDPPAPYFEPECHPLEPQITEEVDGYFIKHWPFPNQRAIQKFRDAGFSRVTCCYYPKARNDRISFGCRLLTVLFLIDGIVSTSFMKIHPQI
jgi:hypothetical protein